MPCSRRICAAVSENSLPKNRVSCPTIRVGFALRLHTWPAMAAVARRTFAKVKSSATIARQPDVPNLIVAVILRIEYLCLRQSIVARRANRKQIGYAGSEKE